MAFNGCGPGGSGRLTCYTTTLLPAWFRERRTTSRIAVTEGWGYDAATGMPVRRDLAVGNGDSFIGQTFFHTQAPNDLGGIESSTYPCRSTAASVCVADNVARTIEYVYDNGPCRK